MVRTSIQSQLMLHYIAEDVAPLSKQFAVVRDIDSESLLISSGDDGNLYMLKNNTAHNSNELINLSAKLGITGHIETFAVTQDRDLTIHIVAAELKSGTTSSTIHVLKPFKPSAYEWLDVKDLKGLLMKGQDCAFKVKKIILGNSDDARGHPLVAVTYAGGVGGSAHNDIALLQIATDNASWTIRTDFKLPEYSDEIFDLCPANVPGARGIVALYEVRGEKRLSFVGIPGKYGLSMAARLEVPPGALHLAAITNAGGKYTDLIVSGNGLYRLSALSITQSGAKASLVSLRGSKDYANIQEMHIAHAQNGPYPSLTIWFRTEEQSVHALKYQLFELQHDLLKDISPVIPLVPLQDSGRRFAALLDPVTFSQKLFITDSSDPRKIKVLEQPGDSKIWQPAKDVTIHVPSSHRTVPAFISVINMTDEKSGVPIPLQKVNISSKTLSTVSVNGVTVVVSTRAQQLTTDPNGNITLISPGEGLVPHLYELSSPDGCDLFPGKKTLLVDPAFEAKRRLQQFDQDGHDLLSHATGPTEMKDRAKMALQQLGSCTKDLSAESQVSGHDNSWSWWGWIDQQVSNLQSWTIEKVQNIWRLVIKVSGKLFDFVLNSIGQVFSAVKLILEQLGIPINQIIKYFGWLYDWDDILYTQNVLSNVVDHFFLVTPAMIQALEPMINTYVDDIKARFLHTSLPPEASNKNHASSSSLTEDDSRDSRAFNSPQVYWTTNLIRNGSISEADKDMPILAGESAKEMENALIKEESGAVASSLEKLGVSISTLLKSASGVSLQDLKNLLVDAVGTGSLELIRKVLLTLVGAGASMVENLRKFMQSQLEIPILSSLCRRLLRKSTVTLQDVICLLFAIPATIAYKIVSGKGPQLPLKNDSTQRLLAQSNSNSSKTITQWADRLSDLVAEHKWAFNAVNRFADAAIIGTTFFQLCPFEDSSLLSEQIDRTKFTMIAPAFLLVPWLAAMPTGRPRFNTDRLRRWSWIISGIPICAQWHTSRKLQSIVRIAVGSVQTITHIIFIGAEWKEIMSRGGAWAGLYISHVLATDLTKLSSAAMTLAAIYNPVVIEVFVAWSACACLGYSIGNFRYYIDPDMENVSLYGT